MTTVTASDDRSTQPEPSVEIYERRVIDEMVAKIQSAAGAPGAAGAVAHWRAEHGTELWHRRGHDHAVVGRNLMYLHDAPDGTLVPHERYPDGREKLYTDLAHAEVISDPD
jgi:hypothetical protein